MDLSQVLGVSERPITPSTLHVMEKAPDLQRGQLRASHGLWREPAGLQGASRQCGVPCPQSVSAPQVICLGEQTQERPQTGHPVWTEHQLHALRA